MEILLIIAVLLILLAVLGFIGVVKVLKAGAWLILVVGLLVLALNFLL